MKKGKGELVRLQSLIEADRLNVCDCFEELLLSDLHKLLSDYFDYSGTPCLSIRREGGSILVEIKLSVLSLKTFSSIPLE